MKVFTRNGLRSRMGFLMLAFVLMAGGCEDEPAPSPRFALTPDEQRDFDLYDLCETFGRHVIAGEYREAYDMTSQRWQSELSFDDFVALHTAAKAEYGEPLAIKSDTLTTGDELESELSGFAKDIPFDDRVARVGLRVTTEVDEQDTIFFTEWFYCWINLVQEEDGIKVDSVEYAAASFW